MTIAESQYEIVWFPVAERWDGEKLKLFETLRDQMEWHSIHLLSVVSQIVAKFIKEKWNFNKKPMLVVMDTQGNIVHHNAIHMMCVWGSLAYPFTAYREKSMWVEMSWSIDLLLDNLEQNMPIWVRLFLSFIPCITKVQTLFMYK